MCLFFQNDHFAKTGSGQLQGKHSKKVRFPYVQMRTLGLIDGEAVEASAVTVPAVVSIGVVGSGAKL
jgi:hypothetical protein